MFYPIPAGGGMRMGLGWSPLDQTGAPSIDAWVCLS